MRYIGNKSKLLSEIDNLLIEKGLKKQGAVFCDLFSGTATVGGYYSGFYRIIANDTLDFSYEFSNGVLLGEKPKFKGLGFDPFTWFETADTNSYKKGFCYNTFSPKAKRQYFSEENAKYIDYIRDTIDEWYSEKKITSGEKSYLIMCLLEAVSKVATVASLSLDDKTIALAFPFLNENGIEFELDAVNLLRLPSSQSKDVIVERTASVGTDVEKLAMLLYLTDDFLRSVTAVCPEAIYTDVL